MKHEITISSFTSPLVRRIFFLFVVCALLPVFSLSIITHWQITRQMESQLQQSLRHASKNTGMSAFDSLHTFESELIGLSSILEKYAEDSPFVATDLISDKEQESILSLAIIRDNGDLRCLIGPPLHLRKIPTLAGETTLFFRATDDGSMARVFMAIPHGSKTPSEEYLLAELSPEDLWEQPLRAVPPNAIVSILASNGLPVFQSGPIPPDVRTRVIRESEQNSTGQFEWEDENVRFLANFWTVFLKGSFVSDNLLILINEERTQATSTIAQFSKYFILICLLTLLLVLLASSIYVRRTLYPLAELQKGTRRIGNGDFKQKINVKSKDEFRELADSFNNMAERIDDQIQDVNLTSQTIRLILSAMNRQVLIRTVLEQFNKILPCQRISIALFQENCTDTLHTTTFIPIAPQIAPAESISILDKAELETFLGIEDYLIFDSLKTLPNLFASLAYNQDSSFLCLPLFKNKTVIGSINLVLVDDTAPASEKLLRTRHVADQVAVALENIRLVEELDHLNWGTLQALARTVDANSPWTAGHSERVANLAVKIGEQSGLKKEELDLLHRGALLHDIGKIGCPTSILDKPDPLEDDEFDVLKSHPVQGAKILEPIALYQAIIPMVGQHHERHNGSGYPDGLAGEEICLGARILIVADVFDALISHRPYRQGWEVAKVLTYLKENSGKMFDPNIVDIFLDEVFPRLAPQEYLPLFEFDAKRFL